MQTLPIPQNTVRFKDQMESILSNQDHQITTASLAECGVLLQHGESTIALPLGRENLNSVHN